MLRTTARSGALALTAALALAALVGCGSDEEPATTSPREAAGLTVTDPWVKSAESGMTAAFGTLVNDGDSDVTVVSVASDVSPTMELHETVESSSGSMAMQPKEGGFTVPAGGEHELAPGGDHIMIMDLTRALQPGEDLTLTLTLDDGSTVEVDAPVKEFSGADEDYQNGEDMDMDMGGM